MGRELDNHRLSSGIGKFLFNFRQVSMRRQSIGSCALITFDKKEVRIRLSARTAYTAQAVDDNAGEANQLSTQNRQQRDQNTRRIAPRAGHQFGALDLSPVRFRKAVY